MVAGGEGINGSIGENASRMLLCMGGNRGKVRLIIGGLLLFGKVVAAVSTCGLSL